MVDYPEAMDYMKTEDLSQYLVNIFYYFILDNVMNNKISDADVSPKQL